MLSALSVKTVIEMRAILIQKIHICILKKHDRGVIIEDFISTLSGHIPKHYEYIKDLPSHP